MVLNIMFCIAVVVVVVDDLRMMAKPFWLGLALCNLACFLGSKLSIQTLLLKKKKVEQGHLYITQMYVEFVNDFYKLVLN